MIGKRFRSLPFIFANDNYTLSGECYSLRCENIALQEDWVYGTIFVGRYYIVS